MMDSTDDSKAQRVDADQPLSRAVEPISAEPISVEPISSTADQPISAANHPNTQSAQVVPDPVASDSVASPEPPELQSRNPIAPTDAPFNDTQSFRDIALVEQKSSVNFRQGGSDFERDRTVISQRPVAAPHEFYKSLPLGDLAEMLEGRQLDHFAVEQIIGGGGMGAVFRGVDQRLDRVVAIKVIPGSKRDFETLRRFRTEAQSAARLDHPNIARVFYVGEAEQWNYIVFEYIDGVNIRDLVDLEGPLSIDDAVFYTRQIAEALQHAQERGVVHRDIKPSNILVTPSGMAKLVDMGLARDTSMDKSTGDQTASGVTLGTFDYISPEQARNPRDADVRSDLYSLGCSMFFMLTGHPPFPEGTALQKLLNHGSLPPPDPRGWREDISDQLYDILMKLMAKRPTDRYQRPVELVNDLLLLAEQENLPRSLGPSTIMLSPSVSQPTLLETHLPWIVATIVLLGSTVWLHSQISLATGFAFPVVSFPTLESGLSSSNPLTSAAAVSSAGEASAPAIVRTTPALDPAQASVPLAPVSLPPEPATANTGTASVAGSKNAMLEPPLEIKLPAAPTGIPAVIVVCATQPTDVALDGWEPSLARAIQRLGSQNGTGEIEIRGIVSLDKPLEIQGFAEVTIRGADAESRIEVDRVLWNANSGGSSVIRITDATVSLNALQLRCTGPEPIAAAPASLALIQLVGNAALNGNSVEFTLQVERASSLHLISTGSQSGSTVRSGVPVDSHSARITLNNCMVRGVASVFKINQTSTSSMDAVQISLNNSIVAVNGRVVDFVGAAGDWGVERIVRFYCDRSSFIAEDGFAQLEYMGSGQPLVGFNRTSQASLFWSKPDVPHIRIVGESADPSENPDQLMLQGMDNAYDQNLGPLCALSRGNSRIADKSVQEGQQAGWYKERATERVIRWRSSPSLLTSFVDARPTDFQLIPAHFVPGYRTQPPPAPLN